MIYIIAGPSGVGKTTFIEEVLKYNKKAEVVDLDVCTEDNRDYTNVIGRRKIEKTTFDKYVRKSFYDAVYSYGKSQYGLKIPNDKKEFDYLIDYPGEYPECAELKQKEWKGILILPPNKDELVNRLVLCGRAYRIQSSLQEYEECLSEIDQDKFMEWFIIINSSRNAFLDSIVNDNIFA